MYEDVEHMTKLITSKTQDRVTTLSIDRPDKGNRITNEMAAALGEDIDEAGRTGSKLIVLRGSGDVFCLGRDMQPDGEQGAATDIRANNTEPALRLFAKFQACPATIVGVVQGKAIGMGCAIAALSDITVSAENAKYQIPEMGRDLPPTIVMWALADRMPRKAIAYMVYSRDPIDAATALSFGLISRIVPEKDLETEVHLLISKLSKNSLVALNAVKTYMRSAPQMDRQGASDYSSNLLSNVLASR